jgi:hypothetical protein
MRGLQRVLAAVVVVAGAASSASAQVKRKAEPAGVALVATLKAEQGFIEDAYAFDGPGGRLVVTRADASTWAEVEVVDLAQGGARLARFDISKATTWPTQVAFALDGSHVFVVGKSAGDEHRVSGFLFAADGKEKRRFGPATDVALTEVGGKPAAAVFNQTTGKDGGVTTEIAFVDLATGKALGKKRVFKADASGFVKSLDLRILFFRAGYGQLVGLKKGAYDKIKDQRLNDVEALYDVTENRVVRTTMIEDLVVFEKRLKLRAPNWRTPAFVIESPDGGRGLVAVTPDDRQLDVPLALGYEHYDPKSLRQQLGRDGRIYFTLTIDPVNPAAVAAKKADPVHIDLYVFDPATGKGERLARLAQNDRPFNWVVAGGRWAVLRKNKGFGRGGPELEVYDLGKK